MTYINLWNETISVLADNGLTWDDVVTVWIDKSLERYSLTKENFEALAKDMEYDDGFGGPEVNRGLRIWGYNKVGMPFVMVRNEYDGAEWWDLYVLYAGLPVREVESLDDFPFKEGKE